MKELIKIKKVATEAVLKSGRILLREFQSFKRNEVKIKEYTQIVTPADKKSEANIIKFIKNNFPAHRILSEEAGDNAKSSEYFWLIDPLDGTTNFSIHNPFFSVSVALAYRQEIVLAVVYFPVLDELFSAVKGKGAFLNNKKIKVSKTKEGKIINGFCHGGTKKDVKKAVSYYAYQKLHSFDCRQLGSASLEFAYVAAGFIDSIVIPGAKIWDVAAGSLLVREAGGSVTDFLGRPWNIKSKDIVASNGLIHKNILVVLKKCK